MTAEAAMLELQGRRDWPAALGALKRLLADTDDTVQVFRIMRALNAGSGKMGYDRLLQSAEGGRIASQQEELAERLSDPAYIASFQPGTLGAAYAGFLRETGYSAQGLADVSRADSQARDLRHPYAWFGRRTRDVHDIWHVLTGYRANEPLGEACLVAFSYAQTRSLGWAVIALGAALKALRTPGERPVAGAILEGYKHGRAASWLLGEDYDRLLREPLEAARARLGIAEPRAYQALSKPA